MKEFFIVIIGNFLWMFWWKKKKGLSKCWSSWAKIFSPFWYRENSKIVPVLYRKSSFVLLFLVITKWSLFCSNWSKNILEIYFGQHLYAKRQYYPLLKLIFNYIFSSFFFFILKIEQTICLSRFSSRGWGWGHWGSASELGRRRRASGQEAVTG